MFFKINQIEATILAREHRTFSTLMFDDSLPKVRSDTDIERGPFLIAHDIDVADFRVLSSSHVVPNRHRSGTGSETPSKIISG